MLYLSPSNKGTVKESYSPDKYPIGDYYNWHGGIHILRGPVTAIGKGTIIAYRIASDYMERTVNGRDHVYSTSFVLVRHKYESLNKQSLVFYSVYGNLLPLNKYEKHQDIPVFGLPLHFKAPSKTEGKAMKGLMMYEKEEKGTDNKVTYTRKELWVIPHGAKVTVDLNDSFSVTEKNSKFTCVKIKYTRWGKTQEGYVRYGDTYIRKENNESCYTVVFESKEGIKPLDSGLAIYAANKINIREIIPEGVEFTLESIEGDWGVLQYEDKTGYIKMDDLKEQIVWREDIEKDCVVNCRIPVNAGACLGHPGNNNLQNYAHIEVFTPESESALQDFLDNSLKDGLDKHGRAGSSGFVCLPKQLSNFIPYTLLGGTSVKMIKKGKFYSRVEIGSFETQAIYSDLVLPSSHKGNYFALNTTARLNSKFDGILVPGDILYFTDEDNQPEWTLFLWETVRNIRYDYPVTGQKFYVENKYLDQIFDFPQQTGKEEKWCIASGNKMKPNAKTELRLYIHVADPDRPYPDSTKLPEGIVLSKKKLTTYKQSHRTDSWYYIDADGTDANGREIKAKGFVNYDSVEEYPPHNWSKFGFRILKPADPSQHLCPNIKAGLIGQLLNLTDTKGKKIWEGTFNHHLNDNVDIISRQVIFHRSEWSYGSSDIVEKIRNEIKDYFVNIIDKNRVTPMEEDIRESELDFHIQKIKDLGFWDQIKVDTSHRDDEEDLEEFPQSPNVFHFHPYAFILQMNRMLEEVCPFCGKKHIDLRKKVKFQTQFDERFGTKKQQMGACFKACKVILVNAGLSDNSALNDNSVIYVAKETNIPVDRIDQSVYLEVDREKTVQGIAYLDEQLEVGYPVLVGVDHTHNKKDSKGDPLNEGTTDHFVVIVGRGCDEGKRWFLFYEVGTEKKVLGKSDKNKLYKESNGFYQGLPAYSSTRKYVLTQIRKNRTI